MAATVQLLLTLVGVTFLFACLQASGLFERAVRRALRACHGRTRMLLPMIFVLAATTSAAGPGAILSTALLAPFAMSAGTRIGLTSFLIAVVLCHGSGAGFLSPFSTTGAVVAALLAGAKLAGHQYWMWMVVASAHALMAGLAYVFFGGLRSSGLIESESSRPPERLTRHQMTNLAIFAIWIVVTAVLRWPLGWSALATGVLLCVAGIASPTSVIRLMPWKLIALVTTISTLVNVLDRTGGLEWFKEMLAWMATPETIHPAIALVGGVVSAYSSTTAVVLPAFLPMIPAIAERFAGVDPFALATSLAVGATLVDASPLSTSGALCIAAAPPGTKSMGTFRKLLLWGFAMAIAAALFCYLASPVFAV